MPTSRPFAYNTGSAIAGTEQVGNLAIGFPIAGFSATGLEWWNGPDEDLGYIITCPVPTDTQPTQDVGNNASIGFYRSKFLTEESFIDLSEFISKKINDPQNFSTGDDAKTWLNSNGYWTSFQSLSIVTSNLQLYLTAGDSDSYPGNGTIWTDLSPNAYTTTRLVNGTGYSSDGGGTLTFDGSTQYVDVNQSLASEEFTVGSWFKTSSPGIKMILCKETIAGWPWNYRIWMNGGTLVGDIAQAGGVNVAISSPLSSYNNGNWYQVMFSRNDSTLRLYVNGVEVVNTPDTLSGSVSNSQELWIGRSAYTGGGARPTGSYPYIGSISEVMIYNRVLTGTEILQNYNATKSRFGL